jgi:hypothetical protein
MRAQLTWVMNDHEYCRVPKLARRAGLDEHIGLVLSTYDASSSDMTFDQVQWLELMHLVSSILQGASAEAFVQARLSFLQRIVQRLKRLLGDSRQPVVSLGALEVFSHRLIQHPGDVGWDEVHWTRGGTLVCLALCEPWFAVGGPAAYHDSYTSRVFLRAADLKALLAQLNDAKSDPSEQTPQLSRR